ncbi:MAG: hypothetical protein ACOYWZ_20135 [Bacillota bacterium]
MKRLLIIVFFLLGLSSFAIAGEDQPFSLPFKIDVNTLYDFQHKTLTGGLSIDAISVYDILYIGIQAVGAAEENFFKNGILGGQANVDVNKGVMELSKLAGLGEGNVKWLLGKYTPRLGVAVTYNFFKNDYYKDWNVFMTMRLLSF